MELDMIGLIGLMQKIGSEDNFAERLKAEMQRRGLSQAKLAKLMEDVGYPLHQSAISKILNPSSGSTRRSVSIDEALAFSRALEIPLPSLLLPPYAVELGQASELLVEAFDMYRQVLTSQEQLQVKFAELVALAARDEKARTLIEQVASSASELADDHNADERDRMHAEFFALLANSIREGDEGNGE